MGDPNITMLISIKIKKNRKQRKKNWEKRGEQDGFVNNQTERKAQTNVEQKSKTKWVGSN